MAVKSIPEGYHSVTPYLIVDGANRLIDFAKQVFGAEEMMRMPAPGGTVGHAEMRIGDSVVMCADAGPRTRRGPPRWFYTSMTVMPPTVRHSRPEGRRTASRGPVLRRPRGRRRCVRRPLVDPHHIEDVPPEEMEKRMAAMQTAG
jgi:PhnB protein